jgi:uncharacterized protein (TIGR00730 family)
MSNKSIDAWQILRIQGEFTRAFDELSDLDRPCIAVFGSARTPKDDKFYQEGLVVGKQLVDAGFGVITGGGPGVMEAVNEGAKDGLSIGLGIELPFEASMNPYVNKGITCRYFFTRKVSLIKYSQGFIVFPGGLGTLDELFEALTLAQTGHSPKFPIILVGKDYWSGLYKWLIDTVFINGKMSNDDFELFRIVDTGEEAVQKIIEHNAKYRPDSNTNF